MHGSAKAPLSSPLLGLADTTSCISMNGLVKYLCGASLYCSALALSISPNFIPPINKIPFTCSFRLIIVLLGRALILCSINKLAICPTWTTSKFQIETECCCSVRSFFYEYCFDFYINDMNISSRFGFLAC